MRTIRIFAMIALPAGWAFLIPPVVLDLPQEPFVLGALVFALILPAFLLMRREPNGGAVVREVLRDAVRPPRPLMWTPLAALAIPLLAWGVASALGGGQPASGGVLGAFVVQLLSSLVIINLLEETVWAGFVQRRLMAVRGVIRGSAVTALLFAGIHLPLAFAEVDSVADVLLGIAVLFGTAFGLRFLIARVDAWSGKSLLAVALAHASFNATPALLDPTYDWVRIAVTTMLGFASLAITSGGRDATLRATPAGSAPGSASTL